jgi:hypothetical protein
MKANLLFLGTLMNVFLSDNCRVSHIHLLTVHEHENTTITREMSFGSTIQLTTSLEMKKTGPPLNAWLS